MGLPGAATGAPRDTRQSGGDDETLAIRDIQDAADVLRPLYLASTRRDGCVSLEVAPDLAHDTAGTIEEARRLWEAVARENVMIKVPAVAYRAEPKVRPSTPGISRGSPLGGLAPRGTPP
jgi:Transaldolase/Fructose-6-phosphate aldolase